MTSFFSAFSSSYRCPEPNAMALPPTNDEAMLNTALLVKIRILSNSDAANNTGMVSARSTRKPVLKAAMIDMGLPSKATPTFTQRASPLRARQVSNNLRPPQSPHLSPQSANSRQHSSTGCSRYTESWRPSQPLARRVVSIFPMVYRRRVRTSCPKGRPKRVLRVSGNVLGGGPWNGLQSKS